MKVLITGGAGFIGSNLALKLKKLGHHVVILDNLSKQVHGEDINNSYTYNLVKDEVEFIKGSVTDINDFRKALKDIDVVIHLAAETGTGQSMYEIIHYVDVNVKGTSILLELLTNEFKNVKKVILASSRSIYGEGKYYCEKDSYVYPIERKEQDMDNNDFEVKCPICNGEVEFCLTDEESMSHPSSVYGFTKKAQEDLSMLVCKSINIPLTVFRFQNVYGPGQSLKNPYTGILSIFSTIIKNGNDINIFEDGLETRDFVYIDDITDAIVLSLNNDKSNYQIFNIGSGEKTDVITVANTLKEKYKASTKIKISGNYRLGDIRHNQADLTKIKELLGYSPKVNFKTGISNFIDWVEGQKIEKDNYEESIKEMKEKGLYK